MSTASASRRIAPLVSWLILISSIALLLPLKLELIILLLTIVTSISAIALLLYSVPGFSIAATYVALAALAYFTPLSFLDTLHPFARLLIAISLWSILLLLGLLLANLLWRLSHHATNHTRQRSHQPPQ